jgi:hypothetical protein
MLRYGKGKLWPKGWETVEVNINLCPTYNNLIYCQVFSMALLIAYENIPYKVQEGLHRWPSKNHEQDDFPVKACHERETSTSRERDFGKRPPRHVTTRERREEYVALYPLGLIQEVP